MNVRPLRADQSPFPMTFVIVTITNYFRVLLYSDYTTITGGGPPDCCMSTTPSHPNRTKRAIV